MDVTQLASYIAPAAPATRRPARGDEPFVRPEIGFTPSWYRESLDVEYGERWHTDVAYRRGTILLMRDELKRRFPGTRIGGIDRPERPLDLLTGLYGCVPVAALYGMTIAYADNGWPNVAHEYLSPGEVESLEPPRLDANPFFECLMEQIDEIEQLEGRVEGFLNWQGVLNNAYRLRGEDLLLDFFDAPERCRHLFDCGCTTMIDGIKGLHERQRASGVEVSFATVSNCLVNMVSPKQYEEFLLPLDRRIARAFDRIGIHNCAWSAAPYMDHYAAVPKLAYIDMGLDSDLVRARETFPDARRALMYTPMDLANSPLNVLREVVEQVAREYAPCDIVVGDIEAGTPDEKVLAFVAMCEEAST